MRVIGDDFDYSSSVAIDYYADNGRGQFEPANDDSYEQSVSQNRWKLRDEQALSSVEQLAPSELQILNIHQNEVVHQENSILAKECLLKIPTNLCDYVISQYKTHYAVSQSAANNYITKLKVEHPIFKYVQNGIQADRDDIKSSGKILTSAWLAFSSTYSLTSDEDIKQLIKDTRVKFGISFPANSNAKSNLKRASEDKYWVRQATNILLREKEMAYIKINPRSLYYCSIDALFHSSGLDLAEDAFRDNSVMVNDTSGLTKKMPSRIDSIAGKRAELIARVKGVGIMADLEGLIPILVTLTCPSRYHPLSARHDGSTPVEANQHLNNCWKKTRAIFSKSKLNVKFLVSVEPHRDGCPHWHLVLWSSDVVKVKEILIAKFLTDHDHEEDIAEDRRVVFTELDGACGGAVSYAIKYVNKHTIGFAGEEHKTVRANAWRRVWGIRSLRVSDSQITLWRMLRKIGLEDTTHDELANAAKAGDYAKFIQLNSQINMRPAYENTENRFDEKIQKLVGLKTDEATFLFHSQWEFKRSSSVTNELVTLNTKEPRNVNDIPTNIIDITISQVANRYNITEPVIEGWIINEQFPRPTIIDGVKGWCIKNLEVAWAKLLREAA